MEIRLHGYLKELHSAPIQVEARTVAEAVTFLQTLPAFSPRTGKKHSVVIDGFQSKDALYDADRNPEVIDIRPVASGGGGKTAAYAQIVIGIIMIAVAWYNPYAWSTAFSGMVALSGAMQVLGGVLQLIAPQPKLDSGSQEKSRYLGQGKNTVAIGTRIPMIYGRRKWGGHYINFNITAGDLNSAPESWYSSPFTDYGEATYSAAPAELPYPPLDQYDGQPETNFTGLTSPNDMTVEKLFVNFAPLVELTAGEWDVNFVTGQTLHVLVEATGLMGQATLLGGTIKDLPPTGTRMIFTQNYG